MILAFSICFVSQKKTKKKTRQIFLYVFFLALPEVTCNNGAEHSPPEE